MPTPHRLCTLGIQENPVLTRVHCTQLSIGYQNANTQVQHFFNFSALWLINMTLYTSGGKIRRLIKHCNDASDIADNCFFADVKYLLGF